MPLFPESQWHGQIEGGSGERREGKRRKRKEKGRDYEGISCFCHQQRIIKQP